MPSRKSGSDSSDATSAMRPNAAANQASPTRGSPPEARRSSALPAHERSTRCHPARERRDAAAGEARDPVGDLAAGPLHGIARGRYVNVRSRGLRCADQACRDASRRGSEGCGALLIGSPRRVVGPSRGSAARHRPGRPQNTQASAPRRNDLTLMAVVAPARNREPRQRARRSRRREHEGDRHETARYLLQLRRTGKRGVRLHVRQCRHAPARHPQGRPRRCAEPRPDPSCHPVHSLLRSRLRRARSRFCDNKG